MTIFVEQLSNHLPYSEIKVVLADCVADDRLLADEKSRSADDWETIFKKRSSTTRDTGISFHV